MRRHYNFSDSEISRFEHEPERRADRHGKALTPPQAAAGAAEFQRSAPNPRDLSLSSLAQSWSAKLPAAQRPHELCNAYPRIANRLALCWGDPVLTANVFRELMTDRRRGRKGFPPAVRQELLALRELALPGVTVR
jgi:hypothetical protein